MKKSIILLIISLFISCKHNESLKTNLISRTSIDKLISENEIKEFIVKIDTNLIKFKLLKPNNFKSLFSDENCKKIGDSLKITSSFIKEDFDNNGYTDLLFTGIYYNDFYIYILKSYGENKYKIDCVFSGEGRKIVYPKLNYIDGIPVLDLYARRKEFDETLKKAIIDKTTLLFKYGKFIEYNANPIKKDISTIEYSTSGCFGSCPVFDLTINKNGKSIFKAKSNNFIKIISNSYGTFIIPDTTKKEGGTFFLEQINQRKYNDLVEMLNYINFEKLKDYYSVNWSDDQTGTLKITYNNGKVKTIRDYGLTGTYGLNLIYSKISELRFSEKWKK